MIKTDIIAIGFVAFAVYLSIGLIGAVLFEWGYEKPYICYVKIILWPVLFLYEVLNVMIFSLKKEDKK